MNENFKVVLNCSLCNEKELQVITDNNTTLMQCIGCGYSTSDNLRGDKESNEEFNQMDDQIKSWSVKENDQIWIPSIVNLSIGVLYPVDEDNQMKWAFAPLENISEMEKGDHLKEDGTPYEKMYDIQNQIVFDKFKDAIFEINLIVSAREELKKKDKKQKVDIKLPKLKKLGDNG